MKKNSINYKTTGCLKTIIDKIMKYHVNFVIDYRFKIVIR